MYGERLYLCEKKIVQSRYASESRSVKKNQRKQFSVENSITKTTTTTKKKLYVILSHGKRNYKRTKKWNLFSVNDREK